jgi:membrane protein DedA with SNARE-associated domain
MNWNDIFLVGFIAAMIATGMIFFVAWCCEKIDDWKSESKRRREVIEKLLAKHGDE